jgi:DeoR/GlpR family transcriptional regulator of sugar metabolism
MNQIVRQKQMCELIARRGECSIEELIDRFEISGMTVRRDLQSLADQGKVIRTHGGAAMAERISFEFEFLNRVREHHAAKEAIAAAAAAEIKDGESVMLDSGTTTLELAKRLRGDCPNVRVSENGTVPFAGRQCPEGVVDTKIRTGPLQGRGGLTVITSSLPIAAQLQYDQRIEVLLLGGRLRASSPDLAGALTESNLETLRADVAFLGADAVDSHGAVYQQSPELARMLTKMAASAGRVFVVADASKLGKTALWRFGRLADWAALITDPSADRSILASLKKSGVRVIKAPY